MSDHPSHKRLLTDPQHILARRMYLGAAMKPKEIATELNQRFSLSLTPLQISEYARARGWTKRRKKDAEKAALLAESRLSVQREQQQLTVQHRDFLDKTAEVGAKIVKKAETFVDRAASAKELSAAANAARTGAEIYRKAVGLGDGDGSSGPRGSLNINFNFATSAGESPFARAKVVSEATAQDGERDDELDDEDPVIETEDQDATEENDTPAEQDSSDQGDR